MQKSKSHIRMQRLILIFAFLFLLMLFPREVVSEKIYTVSEIYELLNNNPKSLRDKIITLRAFVVGGSMVRTMNPSITRCANFSYLIDFDERFIKEYDQAGHIEQRELLNAIPVILSAELKDVGPTQYGIYIGYFYDKEAMRCQDGYKRFKIMDIKEEINISWPMTTRSEIVATGMIIANGKYIKPPYNIELKNHKITINDILYKPYIRDKIIYRWINKQRTRSFDTFVNALKRNRMVIFGGRRYEIRGDRFDERNLRLIDEILKEPESRSYKKKELEKILKISLTDEAFEEFLSNWQ